jgi:hypothetical protein
VSLLQIAEAADELHLYVLPTVMPEDYSVQETGARQVAWLHVNAGHDFDWGWVEHADGQGRTQYGTWDEFITALAVMSGGKKVAAL